jgi:hypothetical protein
LAGDSDSEDTAERFFIEVAPFLFLNINEGNSDDDDDDDDEEEEESQGPDSPDSSPDAASNNKVPGLTDDTMTLDKAQFDEILDAAADAEFLEDIGLSPQAFTELLESTSFA